MVSMILSLMLMMKHDACWQMGSKIDDAKGQLSGQSHPIYVEMYGQLLYWLPLEIVYKSIYNLIYYQNTGTLNMIELSLCCIISISNTVNNFTLISNFPPQLGT